MPTIITEVDQYPADILKPDDGEDVDAASLAQALQPIADRQKYGRERVLGLRTSTPIPIPLTPIAAPGFAFTLTAGLPTSSAGWKQQGSPTGSDEVGPLPFAMPISGGIVLTAKLTHVLVKYRPAGGHGALPATLPRLRVYRQIFTAAAGSAVLVDVSDAPADPTAYQVTRTLQATPNYLLTNQDTFYLLFGGESGANSIGGLTLLYAEALFSLS